MFGPKADTKKPQAEQRVRLEPYDIHVMPVKFHKYLKSKKTNFGRYLLIGVIALIVVLAAGLAAYYFLVVLQPSQRPVINLNLPAVNVNENLNGNININENANENLNANANMNINENVNAINENMNANINANANINGNLNANLNANLNTNENVNLNANINEPIVPEPVTYTSSVDSDRDSLTDIEETLYDTQKNMPDTDADGYLDGAELIGLFNPLAASGSLLATSGLVNTYENPVFNYQIFYPAKWLARPADQSLKEIIFQSETGEYISVFVEDNIGNEALVNWFNAKFPDENLDLLEKKTTKNNMEALLSADKLTYYLYSEKTPDKVYMVNYNISGKTIINMQTTFEMMVNSFAIVPKL